MAVLKRVPASRLGAAIVILLLVAGAILARRSGIDADSLQTRLLSLGIFAAPAFIAAFALGELLHLPGIMIFDSGRGVF